MFIFLEIMKNDVINFGTHCWSTPIKIIGYVYKLALKFVQYQMTYICLILIELLFFEMNFGQSEHMNINHPLFISGNAQ